VYGSLGEKGEWSGYPAIEREMPNVTTNNKNTRFNITVSIFLAGIKTK
jgi:hypothetical protein